jgi:oligosaccharyltransferase complex subunit beta
MIHNIDHFVERGRFSIDQVVSFVNAGGNVLIAASEDPSRATRDLASEFGFLIPSGDARVKDDAAAEAYHLDTGVFRNFLKKLGESRPMNFKGIAHTLNVDNPLIFPLISGQPTSYSVQPDTVAHGQKLQVVSALQARNNARVIFCGSMEFFADR